MVVECCVLGRGRAVRWGQHSEEVSNRLIQEEDGGDEYLGRSRRIRENYNKEVSSNSRIKNVIVSN